jgi:hypothetical protein
MDIALLHRCRQVQASQHRRRLFTDEKKTVKKAAACDREVPSSYIPFATASVTDPGSGAFLTPGSGMGKNQDPDPG